MKAFDALLEVADRLNGPQGCPWDRKQTLRSLQPYVLEEAHEVVEAVDHEKNEEMIEELGDLLYVIVFCAKVAEREGKFSMQEILERIREKQVGRHPHVFGQRKFESEEEFVRWWEEHKKTEKNHETRKSALDGIPPALTLLSRVQKTIDKVRHTTFPLPHYHGQAASEEELGVEMIALVRRCQEKGLDAESALRRALKLLESTYRRWEKSSGEDS